MTSLEDMNLVRNYLESYELTEEIIPHLLSQCQKYGWGPFASHITEKFKKIIKTVDPLKILNTLIDNDISPSTDPQKRKVLHDCLAMILTNYDHPAIGQHCYSLPPLKAKRDAALTKAQNFLISLWKLAKKIKFDISPHAKENRVILIAPVLTRLAEDPTYVDEMWLTTAKHFLPELQRITSQPAPILS